MNKENPGVSRGIFTWFGYVLPFSEKLRLIKGAGFDSVCIWWGDEFSESDGTKEEQLKSALEMGLRIENAHLPYYGCDALWFFDEKGKKCFDFYNESIASAAGAGISRIVMHPFELRIPLGGNRELFIERLNTLTDTAAGGGAVICLENLADNEAFRGIMGLADSRLGVCFDSGHNNVASGGDLSLLEEFSERIYAVHLHDNDGKVDQHLLPGEGIIDWPRLIATLNKTAYGGCLMLESCQPYGYDEAEGYGAAVTVERTAEEYLAAARGALERYCE